MRDRMERGTLIRDHVTIVCAIFAVILVFLVSCERKTQTPPPPPTVTVSQPVKDSVTGYLESTGNTQAVNSVQLVARVAGYLDKVFFHDGQMVKKGQPLFLIQQNTYVARLQQAEGQVSAQKTQLEYAQNQLDRYTNLLPYKASAQTDVDNWRYQRDSAKANLKSAEANRDLSRLDLGYTEITAPFDGRIDRRLVDPGNLVGSGANTVLAVLNQIDPIYLYFTISDVDLARLMKSISGIPGQGRDKNWPVSAGLVKEDGYPHRGEIDFAATSFTATTGTLLLRGVFPNPDGKILPGLYARVRVPLEKKVALLVPDVAVGNDQQGAYLFIVNEKNVTERRNVKTGHQVGDMRVIEEGLKEKEWVVVNGLVKTAPGRQVVPERENPPSGKVSYQFKPEEKR
jgi:RND family efflux transporter MFP subunit